MPEALLFASKQEDLKKPVNGVFALYYYSSTTLLLYILYLLCLEYNVFLLNIYFILSIKNRIILLNMIIPPSKSILSYSKVLI